MQPFSSRSLLDKAAGPVSSRRGFGINAVQSRPSSKDSMQHISNPSIQASHEVIIKGAVGGEGHEPRHSASAAPVRAAACAAPA